MSEVAIKVKAVYKDFRLPHEKVTTIKSAFTGVIKDTFGRKRVETQHALKGISFEVKKGEFFGIVGRNGSGKSTLLKLLAGIYQPSSGFIETQGRVIPFIELGVGFNAELSGRDNIYLNGAVLGFSREEVDKKYKEIVEFAELEKFMDQKLKNYSSGMQVRLAFSVATILADSDILLIDEVLAVGDSAFQRKCFEFFRYLKKIKKTVVFVSHDMSAIREYCDRAIVVSEGEIFKEGKPNDIADAYFDLFTKSDELESGRNISKEKRSGTGDITHKRVDLKQDGRTINIEIELKVEKDIYKPVFGYRLKSDSGMNLMGTNTKFERIKTGSYKKGSTISLNWCIENILSDGRYYVDLSATSTDGTEIFERVTDACNFKLVRKDRNPYPISPKTRFEFKDK